MHIDALGTAWMLGIAPARLDKFRSLVSDFPKPIQEADPIPGMIFTNAIWDIDEVLEFIKKHKKIINRWHEE